MAYIADITTFTGQELSFVRVRDDEGAEGWGQIAPYNPSISAEVLHRMVAYLYLGEDPEQIEQLAERAIMRNNKFTGSFVCRAVGGIDTALWDLRARKQGVNVSALFDGARSELLAYGSSMSRQIAPEAEAERMLRLREEQGFSAFKCRLATANDFAGDNDPWPGRSEQIIEHLRDVLGTEVHLHADANSGYSVEEAIRVGRLLEEYGYRYFEEPCPWWDIEATAAVSKALKNPVCGGEQDFQLNQWQRMLSLHAVHTVQPDVCYVGGFSRTLKVARMAAGKDVLCMPHSANATMVTWYAAYAMCVIDNPGPALEVSIEDPAWTHDVIDPMPVVQNGNVILPTGPGWGVEINPDWLKRSQKQNSTHR